MEHYRLQIPQTRCHFVAGLKLQGGGKFSPLPPSRRLGGKGRPPSRADGNHRQPGIERYSILRIPSGNQVPGKPNNESLHQIPRQKCRRFVGAAKAAPTTTPLYILLKFPAGKLHSQVFRRRHYTSDFYPFQPHTSQYIYSLDCCSMSY